MKKEEQEDIMLMKRSLIMSKLSEYLNESSISRIYRHNEKHDCGTITAFRDSYSYEDNKKRNRKDINIMKISNNRSKSSKNIFKILYL